MTPGYPPNELYSAFSFIGFVISFVPWCWHCKATSIPTCLFLTWTWLLCLVFFTDSVVWNDNAINSAPVWCDISSRIILGGNVGFPISCLLLQRRLYHIASFPQVAHRRRELVIELGLGLGLPLLDIALYYFVQGHRFNLFEEVGCWPAAVSVPWTYPLYICAPLIIGLGGATYGVLTLIHVLRERRGLREALPRHNHEDHPIDSHFVRLLILASVDIFCTITIGSIVIALDAKVGVYHYRGWADLKYKFSAVWAFPSVLWRSNRSSASGIEISRWNPVICAFVFFALFGFAEDAKEKYRAGWKAIKKTAGRFLPESIQSGIGRLIERRRKSRPVLRHMTFAGRSASRTSTLTAASLDDDTSSKNDPGPLEIHNPDHPPRTPLNNTIALPEASHQPEDVTVTTDVVRVSVGRQSVRLLPNGKLDIAFTPDSEKDTFWERPGEIGEDS